MASNSSFMSTPLFLAIIIASPIAQSCTAQSMLERIFTTVSWPNSPQRTMRGAESEMRGLTFWKVSSSEPTSATIFPTFRICMPPVSGAATAFAPRFSTSSLIFMVLLKSVVECSIHTAPGCKPANTPSSAFAPSPMPMAAETCSGRGRPVMTTSQRSASARGEGAQLAPCASSGRTSSLPLASWSTGSSPARSRFPTTAEPSCPTPIIPTRPGRGQAMAVSEVARVRLHSSAWREAACRMWRETAHIAAMALDLHPQKAKSLALK
mmetsp:Transcript_85130/g.253787  ORF Transcript_85130/g.253787 Transcript_85130/m.253787 type:complete len:266 (+) Transcript_85130:496-1293(+)